MRIMKSIFRILFIITCITSLIGCKKNEEKPVKIKKDLKIKIPQQAINQYRTVPPPRVISGNPETVEELQLKDKLSDFNTSLLYFENSLVNKTLTTDDLNSAYHKYAKYIPTQFRQALNSLDEEDLADLSDELLNMPQSYIPVLVTAIQLMGEIAMTAEATFSYERNYTYRKAGYTLTRFNELKTEISNCLRKANEMLIAIKPDLYNTLLLPEDYETFKLNINGLYY